MDDAVFKELQAISNHQYFTAITLAAFLHTLARDGVIKGAHVEQAEAIVSGYILLQAEKTAPGTAMLDEELLDRLCRDFFAAFPRIG